MKEGSGGAPQDSILHPGMILDLDERVEETIIKIKDDTKLGAMANALEKKEKDRKRCR